MCNKEYLEDIKKASTILNLGINRRKAMAEYKAIFPGYREVWYSNNNITNMLSLGRVVDKYRVRYNSWIKDAFFMDTESGTKKFAYRMDNLYKYVPSTAKKVQFLETLKENKEFYTDRQVQRAKVARKVLQAVGYLSIKT